MDDTLKPSDGFDYYVPGTIYFNNFSQFVRDRNQLITGSPDREWYALIKQRFGCFDDALFLVCGNGWVERACYLNGIIKRAVGFDVSPDLVEEARREAAKLRMPATYSVGDGNKIDLPRQAYDAVVNYAACHHIAHVDRLTRQAHGALKPGGVYIMLDYTGPHRNQYSWTAWERAVKAHSRLPAHYRNDLLYPHMPTMLAVDPTEAVHSDLIMGVTARYFDVETSIPLGGGVAHPVLADCHRLLADQHTPDGAALIAAILDEDRKLTAEDPASNLFTFAICRPKPPDRFPTHAQLDAWSEEERDREAAARRNGGRYQEPTALETIYNQFADEKMSLTHKILSLGGTLGRRKTEAAPPPAATTPPTPHAPPPGPTDGPAEFAAKVAEYRKKLASVSSFDAMREIWQTHHFPYRMREQDPFSPAYRSEVLALYQELVRAPYAVQNEITSTHLSAEDFATGFPWLTKNLSVVASELGKALQGLRAIAEHQPSAKSLIEFGAGWGNSAIPLARAGLDVTTVDIDQAFLTRIKREADALAINMTTIHADFLVGARQVNRRYDVVLFSSSFHHCLEFEELLRTIHRQVLADDGCLLFFGEPISNGLSFPWGLRYDGESIWAITCNKWLELGFTEDFFRELLARTGFTVQQVPETTGLGGPGWIARKA